MPWAPCSQPSYSSATSKGSLLARPLMPAWRPRRGRGRGAGRSQRYRFNTDSKSQRESGFSRSPPAVSLLLNSPACLLSPERSGRFSQILREKVSRLDVHHVCNKCLLNHHSLGRPQINLSFSRVRGLVFLKIALLASTPRLFDFWCGYPAVDG